MSLATAYIGVGSNLGDRKKAIADALKLLCRSSHVCFVQSAPVYETQPAGDPSQGLFLNTVWEIETQLEARELLELLLRIESELGRERKKKNEARIIDLDLLFLDGQVIREPDLAVPHPRMHERWFVLKPLWDLRADLIHPVLKKSVCELLDQVNESYKIQKST